MDENNAKSLNRILGAMDTKAMSAQEIVQVFAVLKQFVESIKKANTETLNSMKVSHSKSIDTLQTQAQQKLDEIIRIASQQIKKVKNGRDGRDGKNAPSPDIADIVSKASAMTEDRLLPFIPKIDDIENDIPKLGQKIRDSLELLQGDERLDVSAIKGLKENLERLSILGNAPPQNMASIAGRDIFRDLDISAQFNGVLTTFNIPAVWNVVNVSLSSYPYGSLRKNIDYRYTPTTITFLSTIDPITQLSAGQQCVLTVVNS